MIGIIGGMGPAAGMRFAQLLVGRATAICDQEHPSFALLSYPSTIADRSAYLLGQAAVNPGLAIANIARQMALLGATTVVIPCNTAHAPPILEPVLDVLDKAGVTFCNLIEAAAQAAASASGSDCVGVLSTEGTRSIGLYEAALRDLGIRSLHPNSADQAAISKVIHLVKGGSQPPTGCLDEPVRRLVSEGADLILFGCTELALAAPVGSMFGTVVLDPLVALADRALASDFARNACRGVKGQGLPAEAGK